jgi:hypothetical protein
MKQAMRRYEKQSAKIRDLTRVRGDNAYLCASTYIVASAALYALLCEGLERAVRKVFERCANLVILRGRSVTGAGDSGDLQFSFRSA